ncbi:MAG: AAA family ATPase [Chthoniobacterales bacterium]|nr:AAA family ATPase [Chthoniobacterales bacterium]
MSEFDGEIEKLSAAISGLEAQRAVLGDIVVDPAVAALRQQLARMETGRADEAAADERKLVTIVFADVSGFTALSEQLDPEKVRELINACFDALVPVVQKYEGTIDKFIGDEIMALFGAPIAHEDDAERALRVALEMMSAIAAFNRAHGTELGLHLGINTGLVVAGQIGGRNRRDYSVMGDAVNVAARLEDASCIGEIFVGPTTYRLTNRIFEYEAVPPLVLKGKEAPVEVYRLTGLKAAPKTMRGIQGLHAPLVGRDRELAMTREAVAALGRGEGSVLAIVGEAGLGKSRLLAEARALAAPNIRWAEGRALSYTSSMSYWLAREIMLDLLRLSAIASPGEIGDALRRSGDEHGDAGLFPYLASMLALPLDGAEEERVKFLSGEALQARILSAVRDYVRGRAAKEPLVLVWEDLHWCDPSSKQVYETLLPLTREIPLLVLSAARPEEKSDAAEQRDNNYIRRTVALSPLSRDESGSLIRELLKIENFPDQMRELILSRAEGNPFFLEELLRSLIDAGVVVIDDGRATATRGIASVEIPETVQGVLAARIDRLPSEQKQALQRASVIGRVFQHGVLMFLYDESARIKRRLEGILGELQRREFIQSREQLGSETAALEKDEYIFKHAITHDVAYSSMLLARRKELHQLAAQAIETLFPDRVDELSAPLGYHFERAENAERASFYLGRAAERAQATFANAEAISLYRSAVAAQERVLESADDPRHRAFAAKLNENLGDVLALTGEQEAARVALGAAVSLLSANDELSRSRLHRKIGFSHSQQRHFEDSARVYDRADAELGDRDEERSPEWWEEKVQIQLERMHLFYWQGMVEEMRVVADHYRVAITEHGAGIQRAKFLKMLALALLMESRFQPTGECVDLAKRAVVAAEGEANLSEVCHVRFALGLIQIWHGDFSDALAQCDAALTLAERVGDFILQARCITYRALSYRRLGAIAQAHTDAENALALSRKLGMTQYVAMAQANLAWVAWRQGSYAECGALGRAAIELWHGMEEPLSFDFLALWPLVAAAEAEHDTASAIEWARGFFAEGQNPLPKEVGAVTRDVIEMWEHGQCSEAVSRLSTAIRLAEDCALL